MNLIIAETYEEMSREAVNDLLEILQPIKNPLVCTASGDSPKGMYKELVRQVQEKNIDISSWNFLSLDEWAGMNGDDEGSCRFHLNNDLFGPLNVAESKIIFFDGRASDPQAECDRIENYTKEHGGINVAIVGLGMNGHVGMNEPGTFENSRAHVAEIDSTTQTVGQKYFKNEQKITHGLTLGIASIMEAGNIMLLVSGTKKYSIVQRILEEEINKQLPATYLRKHKNLKVYLDSDAAALIKDE
ncbi:MAG TPA: glucosamine-6-phosphate deaminase [Chitinophagaceae bacterium]|nr:glucosamine-6-phosphate deaminase [Chitinophagaceae bacterium]